MRFAGRLDVGVREVKGDSRDFCLLQEEEKAISGVGFGFGTLQST